MSRPDPYAIFDIDNPVLPQEIEENALASGGYPYDKDMKREKYERDLHILQLELVKLQSYLQVTGERVVIVFEGVDAAGKGGSIKTYLEFLNPRINRIAALPKPSDRERSQWYFQRYATHLPAAGETVLFDRSWYNRAGVEPVMGFCSPQQASQFLIEAPAYERMLINDGIHLFKFWLNIGRDMQLKRFHDRRHDPLKVWKLSPIDLEALRLWDAYQQARDDMLAATDSTHAPWTVILANDKKRARLNLIRHVLNRLAYTDKNEDVIGTADPRIAMGARTFLRLNG